MENYRQFTVKEEAWLNEFKAVMRKAPKTLFLFAGTGLTVFVKDYNGKRYMTDTGNVDGCAPGVTISTPMESDGGDY